MGKILKGICWNESKRLTFENGANLDLYPLPIDKRNLMDIEEKIILEFSVDDITDAEDYQIFGAWREGNYSLVMDLIAAHKGINAVDEWGQTILMMAVQKGVSEVVSALLNTRMPKVDVNKAKSVCNSLIFFFFFNAVKCRFSEWVHCPDLCGRFSINIYAQGSSAPWCRSQLPDEKRWRIGTLAV